MASAQHVLLDTGLLVAWYNAEDPAHLAAVQWLRGFDGQLLSVEPVLAEAAFFLAPSARAALARLTAQGWIELHTPDAQGLQRMAALMDKYADQDPDWADIGLVWLAEKTGVKQIVTVDISDFSVYRIHGRSRFEILAWR